MGKLVLWIEFSRLRLHDCLRLVREKGTAREREKGTMKTIGPWVKLFLLLSLPRTSI